MDAKRPSIPEMKPPPPPGQGNTHNSILLILYLKESSLKHFLFVFLSLGVLSPGGLPFPPQGPQGLMGFGQPRPPVMGYGGVCLLM